LGAFGEAGICTTNDAELDEKLRMIRDHGSRIRYLHEVMGVNARLDEMQAAVLLIKMPHLEHWNAARQRHARTYTEQLQDIVKTVPIIKPWASHVFCYYVVQVHERDQFRRALEQEGIGTNIHYPTPIHLQPACAKYGYKRGMLPITEELASRIVSLPMYPELTEEQLQLVISAVKKHAVSNVS
jgi:dTDP-4-amino-4,6-dideoxygalactose transaminase